MSTIPTTTEVPTEETFNCTNQRQDLDPNYDVSGIGVCIACHHLGSLSRLCPTFVLTVQVLVGFLGTAYLSSLILTGYYLLAFDPCEPPATPESDHDLEDVVTLNEGNDSESDVTPQQSEPQWTPNPIDKWLMSTLPWRTTGRPCRHVSSNTRGNIYTAIGTAFFKVSAIAMIRVRLL